ncbi:MAG: hypothetical protein FJX19_01535 [Alphaproteobacteria bacterium]|nr:hypothetical protein [Alphaproteobacteria bacterium]
MVTLIGWSAIRAGGRGRGGDPGALAWLGTLLRVQDRPSAPDAQDPDVQDPDTQDPDTQDPDTQDPDARCQGSGSPSRRGRCAVCLATGGMPTGGFSAGLARAASARKTGADRKHLVSDRFRPALSTSVIARRRQAAPGSPHLDPAVAPVMRDVVPGGGRSREGGLDLGPERRLIGPDRQQPAGALGGEHGPRGGGKGRDQMQRRGPRRTIMAAPRGLFRRSPTARHGPANPRAQSPRRPPRRAPG